MQEISLGAVSDILGSFDVEEIGKLLQEQIMDREEYNDSAVDQFQPLYANYRRLLRLEEEGGEDEDEINEGINRFYDICHIILNLVREKFDVYVSDDWLETHEQDIPTVTVVFYSFFVLNLYSNLCEIFENYIVRHRTELYEQFKDVNYKTGTFGVDVSPEAEVIMKNIYDICSYALGNLSMDNLSQYMDPGYIPMTIMNELYNNGDLYGDFMRAIADIFSENISFRAQIGFDLIYKIRSRKIKL